jgi:hypothetical protein
MQVEQEEQAATVYPQNNSRSWCNTVSASTGTGTTGAPGPAPSPPIGVDGSTTASHPVSIQCGPNGTVTDRDMSMMLGDTKSSTATFQQQQQQQQQLQQLSDSSVPDYAATNNSNSDMMADNTSDFHGDPNWADHCAIHPLYEAKVAPGWSRVVGNLYRHMETGKRHVCDFNCTNIHWMQTHGVFVCQISGKVARSFAKEPGRVRDKPEASFDFLDFSQGRDPSQPNAAKHAKRGQPMT